MKDSDIQKYRKLAPLEIRTRLMEMPGWGVVNGRLEKEFRFQDFLHSVIFLNKIVNPIEENKNYPRITIAFNLVKISLFTNDAGAITDMDLEIAREIDALA